MFLDRDRSVEKAVRLVAEAAVRGARLIVFPETWLPCYPLWVRVREAASARRA